MPAHPHWLRTYLALLGCTSTALDAIYTCAARSPALVRQLLIDALQLEVVADSSSFWELYASKNASTKTRLFWSVRNAPHLDLHIYWPRPWTLMACSLGRYTIQHQFGAQAAAVHPAVWLQRAIKLATK
jgi:hypothetical protein